MFTTLIVRPIFNLLVVIYAILPGHNFGVAIIVFTIIIRLLMWPLVKKQLHQAKLMRKLQPELKKIKAAAKGNKQKESAMTMELYKERGVNPFSSLGLVLLQLPIFIGLYSGLKHVVTDPQNIISFSYPFVHNLPWIKILATDIHKFDATLFGVVDLSRAAIGKVGGVYWPAMVIVVASAAMQYFQSKQLLPDDKDSRGLRQILKDAGSGKQSDQSEVSAAVGRSTRYFIPGFIFLVTVNIPSALSLYWLTSGIVAYIQQARILGKDDEEMEAIADEPSKKKEVIEGEVISTKPKTKKKKSSNKTKKRRK